MSADKTTDGKVIWALRLYNSSGGYSPAMVRRDTLPVLPEGRQGYVRVEEYEELRAQLEQQRAEFANAQAVEHRKWAALVDDLDAAMSSTAPVATAVTPKPPSQGCVEETRKVLYDILRGVYHQGWSVGTDIPTRIELLLGIKP